MTDREIIELYNQRDERAIKETQTAYGKYCEKIAYNILGDEQEALECVNDTLLKAWENIPPERPHIFSAYLATITRNNAILRYRRETAKNAGKAPCRLFLTTSPKCSRTAPMSSRPPSTERSSPRSTDIWELSPRPTARSSCCGSSSLKAFRISQAAWG